MIKDIMGGFLKNIDFFKLKPRLGRVRLLALSSFWYGIILFMIIMSELILNYPLVTGWVSLITFIIGFINIILLNIRRMNDCDRSGGWVLLIIVPIFGPLLHTALLLIRGTCGDNRYGNPSDNASYMDYLLILVAPLIYFLLSLFHLMPNHFSSQVYDKLHSYGSPILKEVGHLLYGDSAGRVAAVIVLLIDLAIIFLFKRLFEYSFRKSQIEFLPPRPE